MLMAQLLYNKAKILRFLSLLGLISLMAGCTASIDYQAFDLDPNQVINYGQRVKLESAKTADAAWLYGKLQVGDSTAGSKAVLEAELQKIIDSKIELLKLFDPSLLVILDGIINGIPPLISQATNVAGALQLAAYIAPLVGDSDILRTQLFQLRQELASASYSQFNPIAENLITSFERLYKTSVMMSLVIPQKKASKQLSIIELTVNKLEDNLQLVDPMYQNSAQLILTSIRNSLLATRNYVAMMTKQNKIGTNLINSVGALTTEITRIKKGYVDKITDPSSQAEADQKREAAKKAGEELKKTVDDFSESIKTSNDQNLSNLLNEAFAGDVLVMLGDVNLITETRLMNLMRLLSVNPVVIVKTQDDGLLLAEALASAVVNGIAPDYDLGDVANVVGLDVYKLIKAKNDFGMSAVEFNQYLISRAQAMRKQFAQNSGQKTVFVVYDDPLMDVGADVTGMIAEFSQDGNKVLVVTNDPNKLTKYAPFAFDSMDMDSSYLVATELIKADKAKPIDPSMVAEPLVKIAFGSGKPVKLSDLSTLVKDTVARLQIPNVTADIVKDKVIDALAAKGIDTSWVRNSTILFDSLGATKTNLSSRRDYYVQAGRVGGGVDFLVQRQMRELIKGVEDKQARSKQFLYDFLAYNNQLMDIKRQLNLSAKVSEYNNAIEVAKKNALGTLDSMKSLLNSELCWFKPYRDYGDYRYDGGHKAFKEIVLEKQFLPDLAKDPMSLFDKTEGKVTISEATLSAPEKAAIGLNCFLTGPGIKVEKQNNQSALLAKVDSINQRIVKLIDDAKGLSTPMQLQPDIVVDNLKTLKERMKKESSPGKANEHYWKVYISQPELPHGLDVSSITTPFPTSYGEDFDIQNYMLPYPYGRAKIFPNYTKTDKPDHFFAVYSKTENSEGIYNHNDFNLAPNSYKKIWTVGRVYGLAFQRAGASTLNLENVVKDTPAPWSPTYGQFRSFNLRIWAWFLSRIVGNITDGIPVADELYKTPPGGVFIELLFAETNKFLDQANRYLIATYALEVLNEYKEMTELLYTLPTEDIKSFLNAGTDLSKFFNRIESIMKERENIDSIRNGNVNDWINEFFPAEVIDAIPADENDVLKSPTPLDTRLNSIWSGLSASALKIEEMIGKIVSVLALLEP